jgi:hypothetical protein
MEKNYNLLCIVVNQQTGETTFLDSRQWGGMGDQSFEIPLMGPKTTTNNGNSNTQSGNPPLLLQPLKIGLRNNGTIPAN